MVGNPEKDKCPAEKGGGVQMDAVRNWSKHRRKAELFARIALHDLTVKKIVE